MVAVANKERTYIAHGSLPGCVCVHNIMPREFRRELFFVLVQNTIIVSECVDFLFHLFKNKFVIGVTLASLSVIYSQPCLHMIQTHKRLKKKQFKNNNAVY